jgi:hypothetical protein
VRSKGECCICGCLRVDHHVGPSGAWPDDSVHGDGDQPEQRCPSGLLNYTVPKFTTSEGDGAGTTFPYNAGNVAAVLELSAISRGRHKVRDIELYDPQRHPGSPKRIAHHTGDHGSGQRRFGIPYCVNSTWPRVKGSTRRADDWCWLIPYLSRL